MRTESRPRAGNAAELFDRWRVLRTLSSAVLEPAPLHERDAFVVHETEDVLGLIAAVVSARGSSPGRAAWVRLQPPLWSRREGFRRLCFLGERPSEPCGCLKHSSCPGFLSPSEARRRRVSVAGCRSDLPQGFWA